MMKVRTQAVLLNLALIAAVLQASGLGKAIHCAETGG